MFTGYIREERNGNAQKRCFPNPVLFCIFDISIFVNLDSAATMAVKKSVLVIGGGPAGMVTVAALKDSCDVKVYERARETGGQWACVGDSSVDKELLEKYGERHSR